MDIQNPPNSFFENLSKQSVADGFSNWGPVGDTMRCSCGRKYRFESMTMGICTDCHDTGEDIEFID